MHGTWTQRSARLLGRSSTEERDSSSSSPVHLSAVNNARKGKLTDCALCGVPLELRMMAGTASASSRSANPVI